MGRRLISALMIYIAGASMLFSQDFVKQANSEYEKDHYDKAIELYEKAAKQSGTSSELYYNIANSYYRLGNMGEAILYYERALKLDPNNDDARANLAFVNDKANVNTDAGASYFSDKFINLILSYSSNSWAVISLAMFFAFLAALMAYIFMDNVMVRKAGFFGGGIVLVMFIVTMSFTFVAKNHTANNKYAIVVVPSSTLSTSPRVPKDKSEEAFLLNEGYKVEVVDSVKNVDEKDALMWYDVKTSDGHRAWIKSGDVKVI